VTTRANGRKRSYQFELSIAESSLAEGYFVMGFVYPGDEIERRRIEAAALGAGREGALIEEVFVSGNADTRYADHLILSILAKRASPDMPAASVRSARPGGLLRRKRDQ
jgi:hypothetical protein